ncbi:MAG: pyrroline-5-carboxylate reductase [Lachnospiraceae bacterium]|nr:pyrroline-5-carboxylate reductase [Lachnospiraceae bacterium]MDD7377908.1 pyrroline-5-carboxylate reductase [Lachnospiraceae bacterium]MDY4617958.1 pyrroline-5-carboxylate reductase [Lachnospiraceae bacterium]
MKIGFIGLGNMASAMIGGILKKNLYLPEDLIGADKSEEAVKRAAETFHIHTTTDNIEVAEAADVLILAVKPQFFEGMIAEIKGAVGEDKLVISIAPGKTMEWLMDHFGKEMKLVRCMPNTPALVGEGCTGFCTYSMVTEEEQETARKILESFGKAYPVPENLMDTVVGVSGSSPAYVFMFIEAMADEAVAEGMPRALAYEFAAQAVLGSAKMVLETGKHPGELKDMVCSPAGTTIQAVKVLEEKGFRAAVMDAMEACIEKSKNL